MAVLEHLNPSRFYHYFEEITKIPHVSGDMERISNYLVDFAKEHNLFYIQDELKNVIIKKPATAGYEHVPAVIIQGHMDMVGAKTPDSDHDFSKDPLTLMIEGDWVTAKDTTLGADDGVSIAYALAILEAEDIPHPALEVVITVDEEVGLLGAGGLDMSVLDGKLMINIDSEDEDCLIAGCAGGCRTEATLPLQYVEMQGLGYKIVVDGLKGGHSGVDIDKMHANAILLMSRFLYELRNEMNYGLYELQGGEQDNAIPFRAEASILIDEADKDILLNKVETYQNLMKKLYSETDGGICFTTEELGEQVQPALHPASFTKVLYFLMQLPNGIQKMSGDVIGLPETSLNLGSVVMRPDVFAARFCLRSSIDSERQALVEKLEFLTEFLGGECVTDGVYPGWAFVKESKLRDTFVSAYEKNFGKTMKVDIIHAGLECGIFSGAIEGLDCVALGPDMQDIHTVNERLSISSVEHVWILLLDVLKNLK